MPTTLLLAPPPIFRPSHGPDADVRLVIKDDHHLGRDFQRIYEKV